MISTIFHQGSRIRIKIEKDVLNAEAFGKEQKFCFIEERLATNSKFFDPVKKLKLKSMADNNKVAKIKNSQNKLIQYKHQGNIAFQVLLKAQNHNINIYIQELMTIMTYQLTPVPYSLGTSDGFLGKTNKAKGLEYLTKDMVDEYPANTGNLLIMDGNAIYHMMTKIPDTFRGACDTRIM